MERVSVPPVRDSDLELENVTVLVGELVGSVALSDSDRLPLDVGVPIVDDKE